MLKLEPPLTAGSAWRALAVSLAALVPPTAAVALARILATAQRGMICGSTTAGAGHCWACYAAPMMAVATLASWRLADTAPRPVHARVR